MVELQKLVDMSMDYESRAVVVRVASSDERGEHELVPLVNLACADQGTYRSLVRIAATVGLSVWCRAQGPPRSAR